MELLEPLVNRRLWLAGMSLLLFWLSGCYPTDNHPTAPDRAGQALPAAAPDRLAKAPPALIRTVGDAFGAAVAISADGQILAIGAPGEDSVRQSVDDAAWNRSLVNAGTVYLYQYRHGQWSSLGWVQAKDGDSDDRFGSRLGLSADGSVLLVGAPFKDDQRSAQKQMNAGAAYVFRRYDDHWQQEAQLRASNADGFDEFASAMAISADGKTVAISAPGEDGRSQQDESDNQVVNAGAVYLFRHQNSRWQQTTRLKAEQASLMDNFGSALSLSADGRVLAVGADREDGYANAAPRSNSGAVYLFEQHNEAWSLAVKLQSRQADSHDNFGAAVSLSADASWLAVGAPGEAGGTATLDETDNQAANAGAVFVFERNAKGWLQQAYVKAPQGEANDGFGSQLQLSADALRLAVGAPWEDGTVDAVGLNSVHNNQALQAGAVYLFEGTLTGWQPIATVKADNTAAFDHFGKALALTGQGQRLVVGVANEDAGWAEGELSFQRGVALNSGAAYLFGNFASDGGHGWRQESYLKSAPVKAQQLARK